MRNKITIHSRKFDGQIHRSWECVLIKKKGSLLILYGKFENEICHQKLGLILGGTTSIEFYWLDKWFSIFRFHNPDGKLRNYYCNINMPPTFQNSILDYVDLDIDIVVWNDLSSEILDLDEFAENAKKFGYSVELDQKVQVTITELLEMIKTRDFPFDFEK